MRNEDILLKLNVISMVKVCNIAHLRILTSIGYYKKETNLKMFSQLNKVIIILYLPKVQNEKFCHDL